jgi:hypothetical protein
LASLRHATLSASERIRVVFPLDSENNSNRAEGRNQGRTTCGNQWERHAKNWQQSQNNRDVNEGLHGDPDHYTGDHIATEII